MNRSLPRILVITPVRHIAGVPEILESIGTVTYLDDPSLAEVIAVIGDYEAIYTNPNKSKVYIGRDVIDAGRNLKVICTASTGTNHIDKSYAAERGLPILALTEERHVISRISSTAELAFALTLAALRHVVRGHSAVLNGEWDYTRYIGRQMNCLTVGVIGYGRLGSMYAGYCRALGSRVLVFDPYKTVDRPDLDQVADMDMLLTTSDVIALHVHVTEETLGMIDAEHLARMKDDVLLVNTSRGDIVNEEDLVTFLKIHPEARVATDVLADEVRNRLGSQLLQYAAQSEQVIITPHIGGMTREAQEIAYGHAALRLQHYFDQTTHQQGNQNG
jgi:phosphoglycerate dehydrogenase-like enzyme